MPTTQLSDDEVFSKQTVVELFAIIQENRDKIGEAKGAVQSYLEALNKNPRAKAESIIDTIIPFMFSFHDENHNQLSEITEQDAIVMLTTLVNFNPNKYFKIASRSTLNFIESMYHSHNTKTFIGVPSDAVLSIITQQLASDDLEVTSNASKAIIILCEHFHEALRSKCISFIVNNWKTINDKASALEKNTLSTLGVRCASTIIEISIVSSDGMNTFVSSGASQLFLHLLTDSSDPLVQLSAMDLLEQIANIIPEKSLLMNAPANLSNVENLEEDMSIHHTRIAWLFSSDVLTFLLEKAGSNNEIEADPMLGGQALKIICFLCPLAKYHHEDNDVENSFRTDNKLLLQFLNALHNFDYELDETSRIRFIDSISSFAASSNDALKVILEDRVLHERWLNLSISKPKLKSIVLLSVARLLDPSSFSTTTYTNKPSEQLCIRLYQLLGQVNGTRNYDINSTTQILLTLAKSPATEVRIASYMLMKAIIISGNRMGIKLLLNCAGCFEFLINRDYETTKEGKEAKFDIICCILKTEEIQTSLEDGVFNALNRIKQQGPYYVIPRRWDQE